MQDVKPRVLLGNTAGAREIPERSVSWGSRLVRVLRRNPLGVIGGVIVIAFVAVALTASVIAPYKPREISGRSLTPPDSAHWLGTNNLGHDVLSRTIYGTQISLAVGVTSVLFGMVLGATLGLLGGYFGGKVDMFIQRVTELIAAYPGLILALVIVAALGRPNNRSSNIVLLAWQLHLIVIAVGLSFVFGVTRVVRSAVLAQRSLQYIEAAHALGAGWPRILRLHILPNVMPTVIVLASTTIGLAILGEASLSFLGYGVAPGTPSWGLDVSARNREFFLEAPWILLAPAVALSLTVLGFNMLGDTLRDVLDPRMRGR